MFSLINVISVAIQVSEQKNQLNFVNSKKYKNQPQFIIDLNTDDNNQ